MFNLNTIVIPQESQVSSHGRGQEQEIFPTVGLKSILQNSDLLEQLLKPISNKSDDEKKMKETKSFNYSNPCFETSVPELSDLNFEDLLEPNKQLSDHDYTGCNSKLDTGDQEITYKNAFLGPSSIWDKNEIFQIEKFGIEYLGIDEFLNENNLNEADIQFLDGLQNNDSLGTNASQPTAAPVSKPAPQVPISLGGR